MMDVKNFILSYYKNSVDGFHIHRVERSPEAQKEHTHEYFQIYYILSGGLIHYTENDQAALSQGDLFIVPPKRRHRIHITDEVCFYSLSFMADALGTESAANRMATDFLKTIAGGGDMRARIALGEDEVSFAKRLVERIYREFTDKKAGYGELIRSCTASLITLLARNYVSQTAATAVIPDSRAFVRYCIDYMENHCAERLSTAEMAKISAMSESGFCRLFREEVGTSFSKYLNACRIKQSLRYIEQGYKITAIYGLCGFEDFSTFYRNFKRVMGTSPQQYRQTKPPTR